MLGCTQALYEIVPFQSDKIHYFHYVLDPPQYFKQFNQRQQSPFWLLQNTEMQFSPVT